MRFLINFTFLSDEGPTLETLDFAFISAVHRPFHVLICISTLPTQHTTFIVLFEAVSFIPNLRTYKGNKKRGRIAIIAV